MNLSLLQLTRNHIPHLEHRSSMYVAFLDTQRAFDTVWRHVFVVKLHQLGVTGSLWTLIDDCHTNSFCFAVVNQINSDWFPVSQGVRQGRILSIFLYLVYKCSSTGSRKSESRRRNIQRQFIKSNLSR